MPFKYTIGQKENTIFEFSRTKTNNLVFNKNVFYRLMNVQNCKYIMVVNNIQYRIQNCTHNADHYMYSAHYYTVLNLFLLSDFSLRAHFFRFRNPV